MIRPPLRSTLFPYTTLFRSTGLLLGVVFRCFRFIQYSFGKSSLRDDFVAKQKDRKSTRLNSSHITISYAVFCLKKKKTKQTSMRRPSTTSSCQSTYEPPPYP